MCPIDYAFDATQHEPVQSAGTSHPVGTFPAVVADTAIKPTKDGTGGFFEVTFATQQGKAVMRYNLWNKEPKTVEIAHKQLSALCYATGIYKLDFKNDAAALRNAQLQIEVGYQKDQDPTTNPDAKGYTEIKKVLDRNGNEPGKIAAAPQTATAPQPQQAPMQATQNGGWGVSQQPAAPQASANAAPPNASWPGAAPTPVAPAANAPPWAR